MLRTRFSNLFAKLDKNIVITAAALFAAIVVVIYLAATAVNIGRLQREIVDLRLEQLSNNVELAERNFATSVQSLSDNITESLEAITRIQTFMNELEALRAQAGALVSEIETTLTIANPSTSRFGGSDPRY